MRLIVDEKSDGERESLGIGFNVETLNSRDCPRESMESSGFPGTIFCERGVNIFNDYETLCRSAKKKACFIFVVERV